MTATRLRWHNRVTATTAELVIGVTNTMPDISKMSEKEKNEYIKSLEAQVADAPKAREITVTHSKNTGTIVVSGLGGRYPVSLYRTSWKRLLTSDVAKMILGYIKDNEKEISATMESNGRSDR